MTKGFEEQKKAVESGYWPLYRFNPLLKEQGKNPLQLDSKTPTFDFVEYAYGENRYRTLKQSKPEEAARLIELAKKDVADKFRLMEQLANLKCEDEQKNT
jgi:pyruvate-ferredoxin/flavodoxin oxidoreductase